MFTDDLFGRVTARDPLLLAALYVGDPIVCEEVSRLLRLTPFATLARYPGALVEVLNALPELQANLRSTWVRQDPQLTATVFAWAEHARLHVRRADPDPLPPSRVATVMAIMREEQTALR